jgi:isopentenyl diphosphate isomerase/L-lactate dehydrogenase-like FMN-dependent dehydrogenase
VAGGAGAEDTMRANREAFRRWRIVPRLLRDVSHRDLSIEVFGQTLRAPILLAPVGVLSIVHPDAEEAVARAAGDLDVPFILSTASSRSIEQVAAASGDGRRWFQLYWPKSKDFAASLIHRAEAAGYSALVVTLDTFLLGWRDRDIANAYLPFLYGEGVANYFSDPVFRAALDEPPEENPTQAILYFAREFANTALTWHDLGFLREHTRLPILLKGILHPDDARKALDYGVDGLIVSNHGGRQIEGTVAALDALPPIVEAVRGALPVLFDSGIRRGADIAKALCMGARAVLVGRAYVYGLAAGGTQGAARAIEILRDELTRTMKLLGVSSLSELNETLIEIPESWSRSAGSSWARVREQTENRESPLV